MCELRPDLARCSRPLDGVAAAAGACEDSIVAGLRLWRGQAHLLLQCRLGPGRVLALRVRHDRDEHVGVAVAAELEALPLVRPGLVCLYPHRGGVARHGVLLSTEVRHPERVDDVLRGELELDLLTNRDVEL